MKSTICIFIVFTSNSFALNMETEEDKTLCASLKSIINLGILTPPLNIQLMDKTFVNCIKSNYSTFLINYCTNKTRLLSGSSIVISESEEDILNMSPVCINEKEHHLIVVRKYLQSNLHELVNHFWRKLVINVTFLVTDVNSNVSIQTFIPYNDEKCNDTALKIINHFDEATQKWKTDQFFPKKLTNFHRCSVKVTTYQNIVPYIVREEYVNGKIILKGRVIEMIDALAMALNFTTDLDYQPSIGAWGNCFQKVANNDADLFIGNVALDLPRIEYLDFSIPIFFEFLKFVVPPGRTFTHIENLGRVFDTFTWFLINCVLVSVAITICALTMRSPKRVKMYAFGVSYRNAFMDFLATVLGISRASMPNLNIPRIIIMHLLLFFFVIRTIYQVSLFKFLQTDGKVKEVQSIDDMISRGYTFFMLKSYANYLDLSKQEHASKKMVEISDFDEILKKISDTNFKGTLMHTSSVIVYKNELKDKTFVNLFCKEYLMVISMVAYLRKNFYLTEIVNEKIGIFHNAGLIEAWDRRSKIVSHSSINVDDTRKPISLTDLKGIFIIYLICCGASIISFIAEIAFNSLRKRFDGKI